MTALSDTRLHGLAEALGLNVNDNGMVAWNVHRQTKPEGSVGIWVDLRDLLLSPDGAFFILGEMKKRGISVSIWISPNKQSGTVNIGVNLPTFFEEVDELPNAIVSAAAYAMEVSK